MLVSGLFRQMTVIKMSGKGNSLLVITDDGEVYITSLAYIKSLIDGKLKMDFILMNRLPQNMAPDRFKKSPTHDPNNLLGKTNQDASIKNDAFSSKFRNNLAEKQSFTDKVVW